MTIDGHEVWYGEWVGASDISLARAKLVAAKGERRIYLGTDANGTHWCVAHDDERAFKGRAAFQALSWKFIYPVDALPPKPLEERVEELERELAELRKEKGKCPEEK